MAKIPSKKNLLGEQVINTREKDKNKLRKDSNVEKQKKQNFKPLKGKNLLTRINRITGSTNLENYKGNFFDLARQCGYINSLNKKSSFNKRSFLYRRKYELKNKMQSFIWEYHKENKTSQIGRKKVDAIFKAEIDVLIANNEIQKPSGILNKQQLKEKKGERKRVKNEKKALRGEELISKIIHYHGSASLLSYKGNLRDIAAKCGFLSPHSVGGKSNKGGIIRFISAYHNALKATRRFQQKDNIHRHYDALYKELIKKYESVPIPQKKEKSKIKKDPIKIKSFKANSILNDEIRNTNIDKDEIKNLKNISQIKQYEKLTGFKLLDQVLVLYGSGKSETSICTVTGYKIEKIGTFRRAFARSAGVHLAPLSRMINEMRNKELLSKETLENKQPKELFIDREKITTQIKRVYRNPKFRKAILNEYGSICSCCNISMETLLEAAHIIPVENKGNDDVRNGIPLCPTHHTAFDNFLFTINPADNSIIYKDGLSSEDLQITKTKFKSNVSKESLEYRFKLFNED